MSETETKPLVKSNLISPQTGKAMVKIGKRGQIDVQSLEGLQRLAWAFSESDIVRECYRASQKETINRQHAANCVIACRAALTLGIDPLMFLQHTYIVPNGGAIAIDGQIAIAVLNNSPTIKGRIRFLFTGDGKDRACKASVTDAKTGESHSYTVTWKDVVMNRWNREKSQWSTQPELMFRYRSALYLARTSFPDLLMGMRTIDEQDDIDASGGLQSGDEVPQDGMDEVVAEMGTVEETDGEKAALIVKAEKRADEMFAKPAEPEPKETATETDLQDEAANVQGDEPTVAQDEEGPFDDHPELVQDYIDTASEPGTDLDALATKARANIQLSGKQLESVLAAIKKRKET